MRYVYYVNVGNIPRDKAVEYVNQIIEHAKTEGFFEPHEKVLGVAVRDGITRIERLY